MSMFAVASKVSHPAVAGGMLKSRLLHARYLLRCSCWWKAYHDHDEALGTPLYRSRPPVHPSRPLETVQGPLCVEAIWRRIELSLSIVTGPLGAG
ncbi:hypothetical protein K470DRAFT_57739 [Piedraia hortae CBS 480.64]|uniref:Uncharacterized protein n=1 Tax=Piedraia hortae CBS 480.64 TaxID=1314780 RepID=A0A6A7C0F1_9PEZI|nr:hypothetical protein K470DRAFT_57739 [Piedraia hortae CBS 480.64]